MLWTHDQVPELLRLDAHENGIAAKRVFDVVVSIGGLVCVAPLMVFIAIATYVDGGRPIFFSQIRLGQRGQQFCLYKFRKFHENAKAGVGGRAVTVKSDPRLTCVGKFLAETKLDELPQLWNVLKGDMSIVGPRPETLDFADCFGEAYRKVLEHRPGIFGPNQVFFRNEGSLYEKGCAPEQFYRDVLFPLKARVDLAYFPYANIFMDISWIVRGVFAVFGWSSSPRQSLDFVEEVEEWIRQSHQRNHANSVVEQRRDLDREEHNPCGHV